ncbi:hypothetical protein, partial [uncultured Campylobacter sp.]|uniref:hypothetical protein n=1 Tax=uncultured Campylobacter sp. TaxID=218934 RepID=UPI00261B2FF1
MRNYTTLNLKQSSRVKFWRRNFALKIYAEFYALRVPILHRDFYGRLVRILLMRRSKLNSLQSCGAVKF